MLQGILYSLLAGLFIALQGVFNTNINMKTGSWTVTTLVHGVGFLTGLLIILFVRDGSIQQLLSVNKLYYLSGVFGILIVYFAMQGMVNLGPVYSIMILMIAQLMLALLINTNGWFNIEAIALTPGKIIGLLLMLAGVVVFQKW